MDRLSSCYFCGEAVDAAIEEYPLVTSEQYSGIQTDERIELCPSCRRKLTTVVERVLEAALSGDDPATAERIPELDEDDPLIDLDPEAEDSETMTASSVKPLSGSDESAAAGRLSGADDDEADDTDDSNASEEAPVKQNDETAVSEDDTEEPGDETAESGDETAESDDETASPGDETSEGDTGDGDPDAFERSEYNKVVRLLQNRDFPVDIEEITVVARSAYDIDRNTTHEILEALIDHGVVEDEGDRLVRP